MKVAQASGSRGHVLELSRESAHVRAAARNWAAGEIAAEDYRAIRTSVLEAMLQVESGAPDIEVGGSMEAPVDDHVDDCDDQDITAIGAHHDASAAAEGDAGDPAQRGPVPRRSGALLWVAGGAVLLGIILLYGAL